MESIVIPSSLTTSFSSRISQPHQNSRQLFTKRHSRIRVTSSGLAKRKPSSFFPPFIKFNFPEASRRTSQCCESTEASGNSNKLVISLTKSIVYTIACVAIGFTPFAPFKAAIAAPVVISGTKPRYSESEIVLKVKDHEYSNFTRRLLEAVSSLLRVIETVRRENGDIERVKLALKEVRERKEQLQDEILSPLREELAEMRREKYRLVNRGEDIVNEVLKLQWKSEKVEGDEKAEMLEKITKLEEEYGEVWERVGETDDAILRRETMALSIGVRELCFIEREAEELVRRFEREMKWKRMERYTFSDDVLLFALMSFGFQCSSFDLDM